MPADEFGPLVDRSTGETRRDLDDVEGPEVHGAYLGEFPWHSRCRGQATLSGHGIGPERKIDARVLDLSYHASNADRDRSMEGDISLLLPSAYVADGLQIVNRCDGTFVDKNDPDVTVWRNATIAPPGDETAVARADRMRAWLDSEGLRPLWTSTTYKDWIHGTIGPVIGSVIDRRLVWIDGADLVGMRWTFREAVGGGVRSVRDVEEHRGPLCPQR